MRRALLALVVVLLAAGCGISTDDDPRLLADETTTAPESAAATVADSDTTATVYLVVSDTRELEARERPIEPPKTPASVLDALLPQASPEETADGLFSYIPIDTTALGVEVDDDGVVQVDMSAEWNEVAGQTALYAYAQVVLTLADLPGVEGVRFLVESEPVAAPTDVSGLRDVVTKADYARIPIKAN